MILWRKIDLYTTKSLNLEANATKFAMLRIRYDTRCYFNAQSTAGMSQLNLPSGTNN